MRMLASGAIVFSQTSKDKLSVSSASLYHLTAGGNLQSISVYRDGRKHSYTNKSKMEYVINFY